MSEQGRVRPVRIELATSELEGGAYRAWADPGQVLTVLAVSHPGDVFDRIVEPRLGELVPYAEEAAADEPAAGNKKNSPEKKKGKNPAVAGGVGPPNPPPPAL